MVVLSAHILLSIQYKVPSICHRASRVSWPSTLRGVVGVRLIVSVAGETFDLVAIVACADRIGGLPLLLR